MTLRANPFWTAGCDVVDMRLLEPMVHDQPGGSNPEMRGARDIEVAAG